MTIKEYVQQKVFKLLGVIESQNSPNDERLMFTNNEDDIELAKVKEGQIWYLADGDDLLAYYTGKMVSGFLDNPIYNRNNRNYFWSKSTTECNIKRVHSGVAKAIVDTLSNIIGYPSIKVNGVDLTDELDLNNFRYKLTQQARPLTMSEGYGAWKLDVNPKLSDKPIIQYYDGENVDFIYKSGILIGVIFKTYYRNENNDKYVLFETRYTDRVNSYITYDLFKLGKGDQLCVANKKDIPELANLEDKVIEGLGNVLAVPTKYFFDPIRPEYGKSVYAGKYDLFDFLDEIWSQLSQTDRVSTPVEYFNQDVIMRGKNGELSLPRVWNRQIVMRPGGFNNGDGQNKADDIITTQPQLNFEQYISAFKDVLLSTLTGVLSPATLGLDIAKKDNAEAQREKEKVSILTRNNCIDAETKQLKQLIKLYFALMGHSEDLDIEIKYDEFANPSIENEIQVLGAAYSQGQISTEQYVNLLWQDKLTEEEKAKEIAWLDENRTKDDMDIGALMNENGTQTDLSEEGFATETTDGITE